MSDTIYSNTAIGSIDHYAPYDPHRPLALQLAHRHEEAPELVVARARAYYDFLASSGKDQPVTPAETPPPVASRKPRATKAPVAETAPASPAPAPEPEKATAEDLFGETVNPPAEPPTPPVKPATIEDVRTALVAVQSKHGTDKAKGVLKTFVPTGLLADLKKEDYQAVVNAAKAAV